MPSGLVLAIDQGTTNTKALLVARSGQPVFRSSSPVALIHAEGERVEQDPVALWESVSRAIADCVSFAAQAGASIEALAISNQRETAVAWMLRLASLSPTRSAGSVCARQKSASALRRMQIPFAPKPAFLFPLS